MTSRRWPAAPNAEPGIMNRFCSDTSAGGSAGPAGLKRQPRGSSSRRVASRLLTRCQLHVRGKLWKVRHVEAEQEVHGRIGFRAKQSWCLAKQVVAGVGVLRKLAQRQVKPLASGLVEYPRQGPLDQGGRTEDAVGKDAQAAPYRVGYLCRVVERDPAATPACKEAESGHDLKRDSGTQPTWHEEPLAQSTDRDGRQGRGHGRHCLESTLAPCHVTVDFVCNEQGPTDPFKQVDDLLQVRWC